MKKRKKKYLIFINRLSIYLKIKSRKYLHPYNLCVKKKYLSYLPFPNPTNIFFKDFVLYIKIK